MSKPLIGVTMHREEGSLQINLTYVESIKQQGGIPVLLPELVEDVKYVLPHLDGVVVIGGHDINPAYFGEQPHSSLGRTYASRDESDLYIIHQALERNMPLFTICRGHQLLNVALGGTLYQDLPTQKANIIQHQQNSSREEKIHEVQINKNSKLYTIVQKETMLTNSFHHQAIKEIAPDLVVSATTVDGVIEAIECPTQKFCIGVQWHPEGLAYVQDVDAQLLFKAFIESAM